MADTNPHGANQWVLDPRQKLFWDYYVNPKSETFSNAYQSAISAGYEKTTAEQITVTEWFLEKTRRMNLLPKAERVLEETLEMEDTNPILYNGAPLMLDGKALIKRDPALTKIKQDSAKFVASTQGKDVGYSTKTETDITTNGESINSLADLPPEDATKIRAIYEEAMKKKLTKQE